MLQGSLAGKEAFCKVIILGTALPAILFVLLRIPAALFRPYIVFLGEKCRVA